MGHQVSKLELFKIRVVRERERERSTREIQEKDKRILLSFSIHSLSLYHFFIVSFIFLSFFSTPIILLKIIEFFLFVFYTCHSINNFQKFGPFYDIILFNWLSYANS